MPEPTIVFILMIIAGGAGYALAFFDKRLTAALKQKKLDEQESKEKQVVKPDMPTKETSEHTALRILLDKSLKWHLELDGNRLSLDDITIEQRQRLVNVLAQIRPWVDGKPAPAGESARPASPGTTAKPAADNPASTAPRIDMMRGLRTLLEKDVVGSLEKPSSISLVSLIDEILQKRITGTPLALREIKLEEGKYGEVNVMVEHQRYTSVDDVPDPEIQAAIKASIAEFNRSR
jgi:hypothetical protein